MISFDTLHLVLLYSEDTNHHNHHMTIHYMPTSLGSMSFHPYQDKHGINNLQNQKWEVLDILHIQGLEWSLSRHMKLPQN